MYETRTTHFIRNSSLQFKKKFTHTSAAQNGNIMFSVQKTVFLLCNIVQPGVHPGVWPGVLHDMQPGVWPDV